MLTSQWVLLEDTWSRGSGSGSTPCRKGQGIHRSQAPDSPSFLGHLSSLWKDDRRVSAAGRMTPVYPQKPVLPVWEVDYQGIGPLTVILTPRIWRHWMGSVSTHVTSRITSAITRAATNPSSCRSLIICKRVKVVTFLGLLAVRHGGWRTLCALS